MSYALRTASTIALTITRVTLAALSLLMLTALVTASAAAQVVADGRVEVRPLIGAFIPTGAQRDALEDAVVVGGQASYRVVPALAVTATFAWSPSTDRIRRGGPRLDVYQYDAGVELRAPRWVRGAGWGVTPLVGVGVGGRTYDYRDLDTPGKTNFGGYGALGGELGFGRAGIRIEGRDYVAGFKPLSGSGDATTRNDVILTAGLTLRF
jgi:hypothetical protein